MVTFVRLVDLNLRNETYEIIFVAFVDLVTCAKNLVNISEDLVPDSFDGIDKFLKS